MTAASDWTEPAQTVTRELWDATRYNELINNWRTLGGAWTVFTPTLVWTGAGTDGNGGVSSLSGAYLLMGRLAMVRVSMSVDVSGSWAEGTNLWGFDLSALVDGLPAAQPATATYLDTGGKPWPLGATIDTSRHLVTSLEGGAFPTTAATGHLLTAAATFEHNG